MKKKKSLDIPTQTNYKYWASWKCNLTDHGEENEYKVTVIVICGSSQQNDRKPSSESLLNYSLGMRAEFLVLCYQMSASSSHCDLELKVMWSSTFHTHHIKVTGLWALCPDRMGSMSKFLWLLSLIYSPRHRPSRAHPSEECILNLCALQVGTTHSSSDSG